MLLNRMKKNVLCVLMFVVGLLSVSIANAFGGYYSFVAIVEVVLFTMFVYHLLDDIHVLRDNVINLSLCALITFFQIIFFFVNDVFDKPVYVKESLGFFGIAVIISQIISAIAIAYVAVNLVIDLRKNKIEVVDHENDTLYEKKEDTVEIKDELEKKNTFAQTGDIVESDDKELKSIAEQNIKVEAPFMQEEK